MTETEEMCPSCNVSFDGGPIPENIREHYAPPYRWSRKIAIVDPELDEVVCWQCPYCSHQWGRK